MGKVKNAFHDEICEAEEINDYVRSEFPITVEVASDKLHCSIRWLREHMRDRNIGRKAGRVWILTEKDFDELLESLKCPSKSSKEAKRGTSGVRSQDRKFMKVQELLTPKKRNKNLKNFNTISGKDISMEIKF